MGDLGVLGCSHDSRGHQSAGVHRGDGGGRCGPRHRGEGIGPAGGRRALRGAGRPGRRQRAEAAARGSPPGSSPGRRSRSPAPTTCGRSSPTAPPPSRSRRAAGTTSSTARTSCPVRAASASSSTTTPARSSTPTGSSAAPPRTAPAGRRPWGTWLSGEEADGGQIWECDPAVEDAGVARPAMGVFHHEAAAVDPENEVVYLTEDEPDGALLPLHPRRLPGPLRRPPRGGLHRPRRGGHLVRGARPVRSRTSPPGCRSPR